MALGDHPQIELTPESSREFPRGPFKGRETPRERYRESPRERPQYRDINESLVSKLDIIASQNQTIIKLLREINMNLSYKLRR